MLFLCFDPPSLCCFSRNLAPLLRSEGFRPHFRSFFPAFFAAFAAHLLHDFRNQIGIHDLDSTGHGPILPTNGIPTKNSIGQPSVRLAVRHARHVPDQNSCGERLLLGS